VSQIEKIETALPAAKLVFHVFAALAKFERNLIRERTLAGLRAARTRSRNAGRPRKLRAKDIQAINSLMDAGELPGGSPREGVGRLSHRWLVEPIVS
jgi:DNA invertase Pin-like site-specific DNA recombinase